MRGKPKKMMTVDEYLVFERTSETRHEFYQGEIFAMAGAKRAHNRIVSNIGGELREQFRNRNCEEFMNDMRVRVSPNGLYTYPDVVALCGEPKFFDDQFDTLINPNAIFEVLSLSTESYDRGKKFQLYRNSDTFTDYILVSQDQISVEHFTRLDDDSWRMRVFRDLTGVISIESLDCKLKLAEIYHKIDFEKEEILAESE